VIGLAGLVGAGVLAWPAASALAAQDEAYKRDEGSTELVLVGDDDDDDTNGDTKGDTNGDTSRGTGDSRSTNDGTRSNVTAVSRDRDLSRSDKTRDKTKDGPGGTTRDHSAGQTNDASRNDTRG
jgi:hypothetical protein